MSTNAKFISSHAIAGREEIKPRRRKSQVKKVVTNGSHGQKFSDAAPDNRSTTTLRSGEAMAIMKIASWLRRFADEL